MLIETRIDSRGIKHLHNKYDLSVITSLLKFGTSLIQKKKNFDGILSKMEHITELVYKGLLVGLYSEMFDCVPGNYISICGWIQGYMYRRNAYTQFEIDAKIIKNHTNLILLKELSHALDYPYNYCYICKSPNDILFICVRGSNVTDAVNNVLTVDDMISVDGVNVMRGAWNFYKEFIEKQIVESVEDTDYIIINGYSLGTFVASIAGWKMAEKFPNKSFVVLMQNGGSRTGNENFVDRFLKTSNLRVLHLMNTYEYLAQIPLSSDKPNYDYSNLVKYSFDTRTGRLETVDKPLSHMITLFWLGIPWHQIYVTAPCFLSRLFVNYKNLHRFSEEYFGNWLEKQI